MRASAQNDQPEIDDTGRPAQDEGQNLAAADQGHFVNPDEESLRETKIERDPRVEVAIQRNHVANRLAAANRKTRLLWIALILSLLGHVIVPVYLVMAMTKPEKVALMDGTETLIIAPLVPVEQSDEILNTVSYWAAKSFLDRGPQGFDAPDTLNRVFLPAAAEKAKNEFKSLADEFKKKNIHQKLEIARIDLQRIGGGIVMSRVIGQILTQAQFGDQQVDQPQSVALNLKLVRNPFLGRNQRYPFAVVEYAFGQPEPLSVQTTDNK
jgi:hypothetical protein